VEHAPGPGGGKGVTICYTPDDLLEVTMAGAHQALSPAARACIAALDAFGCVDRATAVKLLPSWVRRSELGADDLKAVVAHYPVLPGGPAELEKP
jgi:hypothetical protein